MKSTFFFINLAICCLQACKDQRHEGAKAMDKFVNGLMSKMTLDEKLRQLNLPVMSEITAGDSEQVKSVILTLK